MKVSSVLQALKPLKSSLVEDMDIKGAYLDSRKVEKGSIFFAFKGEQSDGNDYASSALNQGASLVVMDNEEKYSLVSGNKALVNNTLESMKLLGALRFSKSCQKKIAVTGSFGKTGMKEMLKCIFQEAFNIYGTDGNKNNYLGVALTGCGIDDNADVLIIELGSNNMGEIPALSKIVMSDMAIVTSAGHAHIGRFGTLERIVFEKLSITDGLKQGGVLIIPQNLKPFIPKGDFKYYTFGCAETASIYMTEVTHKGSYILFKTNLDSQEYKFNHPYLHVAQNSLCAILAAHIFGIESKKIAKGLEKYRTSKGHGSITSFNDLLIIDDTYNAGFESILKSAESLSYINNSNKYAIFGEMGEIEGYERELYNEVAHLAYDYPDITFFLCGNAYKDASELENRKIFISKEDCINAVKEIKKGVILVKAARSRKFEDIVKVFIND